MCNYISIDDFVWLFVFLARRHHYRQEPASKRLGPDRNLPANCQLTAGSWSQRRNVAHKGKNVPKIKVGRFRYAALWDTDFKIDVVHCISEECDILSHWYELENSGQLYLKLIKNRTKASAQTKQTHVLSISLTIAQTFYVFRGFTFQLVGWRKRRFT